MKRNLFLVSASLFWLVMMSLLIHREFFQFSAIQAQHQILPLSLDIREEYNAILMGTERIGFNFTMLESKDEDPEAPLELRHQTFLSFRFLGHEREMLTRGKAKLNRSLHLKEFEAQIRSQDTWTKLSGQIAKNNMNLVIESNESEPVRKIIPLNGPLLYTEAFRFLWTPDNLKIGKQGSVQAWNPLLAAVQTIQFQVKDKTFLEQAGEKIPVFLVTASSGGLEARSWVNSEGIVLKEENLSGITSVKEEGWQIFDKMRTQKAQLPDLPNLYSIPSNQKIENPSAVQSLKVKIITPSEEKIMTLEKSSLEGLESVTLPFSDESLTAYLSATPWIDKENPALAEKAREITGGTSSAPEAARKILQWTHQSVAPVPSMSLPKASQVLSARKGDCNEYTVLFTALARASGIPARMIAGLVYQEGRFYYHAWTEVFLGRWITADPTFGQFPADAARIPLIEGDLEQQAALITQIGNLKIEILETR